jgi:hypothetical protein
LDFLFPWLPLAILFLVAILYLFLLRDWLPVGGRRHISPAKGLLYSICWLSYMVGWLG